MAHRCRHAGEGSKPPKGAEVKSYGAERTRKRSCLGSRSLRQLNQKRQKNYRLMRQNKVQETGTVNSEPLSLTIMAAYNSLTRVSKVRSPKSKVQGPKADNSEQ